MSAILTKLLWPLVNPATMLLVLMPSALLVLWLARRGSAARRWAGRLVGLLLVILAAAAVFPPAYWAVRPLEDMYALPVLPARVDGIVVLSGAERPALSAARHQPQTNESAERLLAFAALARHYPEAKLVYTGAGIPAQTGGVSEDGVAQQVLNWIGLDTDRVIFERAARNTRENAVLGKAAAQPQPGETWLMVTSAVHMPRAMACFQAVDWTVLPYPVDYATMGAMEPWIDFDPLLGLRSLNLATREWLGLVMYRLLGHTRTILPQR